MMQSVSRHGFLALVVSLGFVGASVAAQTRAETPQPPTLAQPAASLRAPTRADILRGEYGRYRANNDLLFYNFTVRVDPEKKHLSGHNVVRFRMLTDDARIQLDLYANLA